MDANLFPGAGNPNREPPSVGLVVLLAQGWDPVEAIDAIRRARPIAYVAYAEHALA